MAKLARLYQEACTRIKRLEIRVTRLETDRQRPVVVERPVYRQSGCAVRQDPIAGWR